MAGRPPFNNAPGTSLEERAKQRQLQIEKRASMTSAMRATMARKASNTPVAAPTPPPRYQRNVDGYLCALDAFPFHRTGSSDAVAVSSAYRELTKSAIEVMNDGSAQVVMSWPLSQTCPSGIVALLALGSVGSARRRSTQVWGVTSNSHERAEGVRIVLFPYARSTHAPAREVQVDRDRLGTLNFDHLKRFVTEQEEPALKDYHQVLSRVRNLNGRATDGRTYVEFEHPILDEIVPHGPPKGDRSSNSELLWRTRGKTDIGKQARSGDADEPSKAHFFVYTIRERDRFGVQLRAIRTAPDLMILDLSRAGRGRLGWNWLKRAKEAVDCLHEVHSETGILAITDDPWTYRAVRFDILGIPTPGRKGRTTPARSKVVLATETEIIESRHRPPASYVGAGKIEVDGFFGETDRTIEKLRDLARRLDDQSDGESASAVRDVIATVRRSACLPGSLAAFSRFLVKETTTAMAADLLAQYRIGAAVTALRDARNQASQADAETAATVDAIRTMKSLERATPMTSMLDEAIKPALRSSSRTLMVFRSDMIAEFTLAEMTPRHPKLGDRIENDMIRIGGDRALSALKDIPSSARNQFKRAILVAPTRPSILALFAEPWLPDDLVILADADTLAFAAKDAVRLAEELPDGPIAKRLRDFAKVADKRVSEIGRHAVQLDNLAPPEDVEYSTGNVLDLSGGRSDKRLLEITMNNGQRIIARQSTEIVLRNAGAATTAFIQVAALKVRPGDEVCVIGPAFVERARTIVNIRAKAAEEIREYHQQVEKRFARVEGGTIVERLRNVVAVMGAPKVSPDTARYWVDLADELEKASHDVVPHAPQDRETFLRFTAALGIGASLAENFWLWAVVAQRSHRMRAGNLFHDAFRGILVDPHSAIAENSGRSGDIRSLRGLAEEHVATVAEVRNMQAK
ncbi:hypothetical protein VSX64_20395 [Aurantimonas sp. C2-6-R+9]|uniref:hypothetical protein n=1 Tax=unclassified Aurantimonas TaxID=2638230 RepID=UPI002E17C526|nr:MULTISPECIES: hypothetical protein [unclassified Aurantimonas]MEC5293242.1 hypothetical protein [Aurantimonas sp. C2-3-R2]MEC5383188.1 hypothetical protein [Aurantimonas sp. C2-6-R+9]MEC5414194.1 hypothetical protein [Aurantimonas sp. C2-4-R8]